MNLKKLPKRLAVVIAFPLLFVFICWFMVGVWLTCAAMFLGGKCCSEIGRWENAQFNHIICWLADLREWAC